MHFLAESKACSVQEMKFLFENLLQQHLSSIKWHIRDNRKWNGRQFYFDVANVRNLLWLYCAAYHLILCLLYKYLYLSWCRWQPIKPDYKMKRSRKAPCLEFLGHLEVLRRRILHVDNWLVSWFRESLSVLFEDCVVVVWSVFCGCPLIRTVHPLIWLC